MTPIDNASSGEETEPREPDASSYPASRDPAATQGVHGSNQGGFQEAWDYLRAGVGSSSELDSASSSERERQQIALAAWARQTGRVVADQIIAVLPVVSNSTSEHEVRYRASDERAVKITWPGFYGQVPVIRDGTLQRTAASPAQYLSRMMLHNEVFRGATELIELDGIHTSDRPSLVIGEPPGQPSFVVTQHWYQAAGPDPHPSLEQVAEFMRGFGFLRVLGSYFGWVRPADGIVIADARTDNFILTLQGVIPIDLQMTQFEPVVLQQQGVLGVED